MGCDYEILDKSTIAGEPIGSIKVKTSKNLRSFTIEGDILPKLIDEIPILTVAACFCNGVSEIKDAQELRVKETDRLKVMARQLQKFGAEITEKEDGLIICGQSKFHSAEVDSETDHRVAMSLAIASLLAKGTSKIMRSDAASVSYPTFWEELAKLTNYPKKFLSELIEVLTKDGSYSLKSVFFQENFHSLLGALEETKLKFTATSNLQRFKGKSLNVLDICFGLGYNSASLLNELIKQKSNLNLYALEIDKKPLQYSLRNESFLKLWNPKVKKIFDSIYRKDYFEDQFFKCRILWGDAREKINIIPAGNKFDLIYLDGFSPQKCPQVWTIEFLSKVTEKLNSQGYLITYSSSAAVRKTLRNLGLDIFTIKPSFKNRPFWSQGTVAISKFDKKKLKPNFNFEKLSLMEEEHLLTKASIPYRDQDLNSSKEDIIRRRVDEQLISNLLSTNIWREKWGMSKLSFKS